MFQWSSQKIFIRTEKGSYVNLLQAQAVYLNISGTRFRVALEFQRDGEDQNIWTIATFDTKEEAQAYLDSLFK